MILKENSLERFNFVCTRCDHAWVADYDVQHVEDGHGHERDYFFRAQLHCPDPTGLGETTCPRCGRASILASRSTQSTHQAVANKAPERQVETTAPDYATAQVSAALLTAVP
jgi:ribosomal protein S27AE